MFKYFCELLYIYIKVLESLKYQTRDYNQNVLT